MSITRLQYILPFLVISPRLAQTKNFLFENFFKIFPFFYNICRKIHIAAMGDISYFWLSLSDGSMLILLNVVSQVHISILLIEWYTNFHFFLKFLLPFINKSKKVLISTMIFNETNTLYHFVVSQFLTNPLVT